MALRGNSSADVRDAEITSIIPIDWDFAGWTDAPAVDAPTPQRTTPRRAPVPAEVTQDILIAEYEFDETTHEHPFAVRGAEFDDFDFVPGPTPQPRKSSGRHRIAAPPHALKGRAALLAVAAGAAVVAATGQFDTGSTTEPAQTADAAVNQPAVNQAAAVTPAGPSAGDAGVVEAAPPADMHNFTDQLQAGDKLAKDAAAADAASRTPLYASPVPFGAYQFTSCFCSRWGTFHGGIDFAAPLGTPIHSATDGEVIEAGPASGFGNWIQVKAPDGSITMYGHMATSGVLVAKGQKVMAGQVIGLVGNEGFSTGPHVHVEHWVNGMKVDPMPWFAKNGVRLSAYTG